MLPAKSDWPIISKKLNGSVYGDNSRSSPSKRRIRVRALGSCFGFNRVRDEQGKPLQETYGQTLLAQKPNKRS
jgi:hypothetical protein